MNTSSLIFVVCLVSTFIIIQDVFCRKLPSFITPCKRDNPDIGKCWIEVVEQMRPHMKQGIPEMGIPPCDPLIIPKLELQQPQGTSVGFDATLTNLTFIGGLDFKMKNVKIDLEKGLFYMEINFPTLKMSGDYTSRGKVLLITFEGEGKANGEYGNVTLFASYKDIKVDKNGKTHYLVGDKNTTVQVSTIKIHFDNLFKNNPAITENVNRLINENTEILFGEIKPIIEQTIGDLVTSVVDTVNERFSVDELFPV